MRRGGKLKLHNIFEVAIDFPPKPTCALTQLDQNFVPSLAFIAKILAHIKQLKIIADIKQMILL